MWEKGVVAYLIFQWVQFGGGTQLIDRVHRLASANVRRATFRVNIFLLGSVLD